MFNGKYITIDRMLMDISKYPFVEELTKRDASHHLVTALGLMGATMPLVRKYKDVEIIQHKGVMPTDIVYLHGVNFKGDSCDNQGVVMKYASDIYNSVLHSDLAKKECTTPTTTTETTETTTKEVGGVGEIIVPIWNVAPLEDPTVENSYNINGMSIDTSEPSGWVELSYDAIPTDDSGYPMIPDEPAFKEAFKYYLLKTTAEPAYFRGTISRNVYQDIEQKYYAYIGSAANRFNMPSPDQMESISNTLIRIMPNEHQARDGWKSANRNKY